MPSFRRVFCLLVVTTMYLGCNPDALASEKKQTTVRATVQQFYTALNQVFEGELKEMDKLWSHADDVTYHGPTGGIKQG